MTQTGITGTTMEYQTEAAKHAPKNGSGLQVALPMWILRTDVCSAIPGPMIPIIRLNIISSLLLFSLLTPMPLYAGNLPVAKLHATLMVIRFWFQQPAMT